MEAPFFFRVIIANHFSHSDYCIMTSTMEEQPTSAPSVESPPGATTTDPTGTTNKLERAVDQLNAHMDRMSTFLGQLCQSIPNGKCSRNAREAGSHDPTGTNEPKRKRQRGSESFSSDEEADDPCMKFSKDSDAISVTASDEEVQNLLDGVSGGSSHKNDNNKGAEEHDEILKELTATFRDEDKRGPPINRQLAEMANKRWGKKLEQEKMSSLLTKYDPPENCVDITVTRVNSEIWQSLISFRKKADLRLANLQQAFQKATFATLTNADKLLRITDLSGPSKKELLTNSIDIVALLGEAASEISLLRQEQMKPALKPEFHGLCSSETKASAKFLFGEDLAKQVRDVKETHRIGNTVGSFNGDSRGYRRDSWSAKRETHNKSGSHSRPPFLGPNSRKKVPYQKSGNPAGKK